MKTTKRITLYLPIKMAKDIKDLAKEEKSTISALLREAFRQCRAQKALDKLSKLGKAAVKNKGLKPEDLDCFEC